MPSEPEDHPDQAPHLLGDDGEGRIVAALDELRSVLSESGGAYWETNTARQKAPLEEWARNLGLLLDPGSILPLLKQGGQEHDFFLNEQENRCVKLTRQGVFGLTPGIDLLLVPSGEDDRRFHLWEASPYQYLERLRLQNLITPGINRLEGIVVQEDDLAICISQPRLELHPVTQTEIDSWFTDLGFQVVATAAYYREADNLGVFDAHDKNVVRSEPDSDLLIPFDVIPVQPNDRFLKFIRDTLHAGHSLSVERKTHTTTRAS